MAAEGKLCVCPQCGKKYKLKEGFAAKSFACKACSATVWVEGKPPAPTSRRGKAAGKRRAAPVRGRARTGRGRARGRAPAAAAAAEEEAHEGRRPRYSSQQNNSTNVILAVSGLVIIVGAVLFFLLNKKDEPKKTVARTETRDVLDEPTPADLNPTRPEQPETPKPAPVEGTGDEPQPAGTEDEPQTPQDDGSATPKVSRKLGGGVKGAKRGASRWDPPADLPHLEDTPPDLQKQIDELVAMMMDVYAGRDSLDAKTKLVAIGKPAFLRILGAMAKIRDTITDVDSMEERLIESSLKLADEALREMDGYLNSKEKQPIRPGTDKKYIQYILRLHYKRWQQTLHKMPEMPGAYIPGSEDEEG